ncbi:flagellar basal-body MS-ring/collar protein FliF [Methylocapsa acidiphila]|uniref:flagellar basal-body MS-ring/collar protein FliF n=1 Tax=Methylocapsa acidiphila TaxID=133552 RepID=UPI00047B51DA|nr:flagellar basal-body MS-ring/collar protein FliF [Methylocapsa acidiphila]
MNGREQIERLWASLQKLGSRRLVALAMIGASVFVMTGLVGYFLSRPAMDVLYAGLDRQDIARIGSALRDADVAFDVNADGNTILVRYGETARARMLLAEKGLPNSPNAGNELFDKLGSLGLTSFMQEVTRVRALEGELARTIQLMRGVKAARVHIVMPDEGSFRRTRQPPSASVVIRTESGDDVSEARAIRHLVAASVPGMKMEDVTVLNTQGVLLASGNELADAAPGGMITLEKTVSQEILDNIRKTLAPYLGLRNFQVSVAARLNTDKKQTNETIFNPESRVERSVRVVKQNQVSQNSSNQSPVTAERNIPQETPRSDDGKQSNEENQKREELTNYELSSKTINTTSGGYGIENISVAVLVNRSSLVSSLGDKATPEAIDRQIGELMQLVASAAGTHKERGDVIKISAVDFVDEGRDLAPQPPPAVTELLVRQSGNVLNAVTVLIVTLLLIWFGLRPATKAIFAAPSRAAEVPTEMQALENLVGLDVGDESRAQLPNWGSQSEISLIEDLTNNPKRSPQKRLEQIVEYDEEQAAAILKQWMHQGERA